MHRKYILFHAVNATEDVFFGEGSRDNAAEPFIAFKRRCAELGYTLDMTRDQPLDEIAWIIFWDVDSLGPQTLGDRLRHFAKVLLRKQHPFRNILREATRSANRPGLALIVAEPP